MAGNGTPSNRQSAMSSPRMNLDDGGASTRKYSTPKSSGSGSRAMGQSSLGGGSGSRSSTMTSHQESVISPSKMKMRVNSGRRTSSSSNASPSSSASLMKPPISSTARDSRDDVNAVASTTMRQRGLEQQRSPPRMSNGSVTPRRSSTRTISASSPRGNEEMRRELQQQQQQRAENSASRPRKEMNAETNSNGKDDDDTTEYEEAAPTPTSAPPPLSPHRNRHQQQHPSPRKQSLSVESPRSKMQQQMFENLREPDKTLKDLLMVLTDESTSHLRRVNACGAIKTLTLSKSNVIPLARTKGVVSSITSVLCRVDATEEERTRCINALMHLCVPEENWRLVYLFPQTAEALARNMADRYPQIRYAACLTLSFLAKKNRKELVKNKILMHSIARVLEVDKNGVLDRISVQDRKVFVGSRLCALKMLLHLSKNKDISTKLARTDCITSCLARIASSMELAANILCIAILTNLTRHPENASQLVNKVPGLVPMLVSTTEEGTDVECAKCSLYAIQNLSCTGSCRQELANTPNLLASITKNAFKTQNPEQQLSALNTLKNLSDDPFNLVTMTNTPGCTATLLALANDSSNNMAQFLACDTLATLSHWLLTLSAAKRCKDKNDDPDMGRRTFDTSTWEMWN